MTTVAPSQPPAQASPRQLAATFGWLGGAVLGLVLAVAAALKALDPDGFVEQIVLEQVTLGFPPRLVAFVALAIEAGLGGALIVNLRRRSVLVAATLLVAFFLFLTGRGAFRAAHGIADPASACGCFGNLVERTPAEAFMQDLLLLVPALGLAWIGRPGRSGGRDLLAIRASVASGLALAVVALAAAAPRLPLDNLATRLRPGVELAELCAGAGDARICLSHLSPKLGQGEHLVVLTDVRAADFATLAARLDRYVGSGTQPPVTVLADFSAEERQALTWEIAPAFDLQETPRALLRPLYRRLPRSFRVVDGRVATTWAGLPPTVGEVDLRDGS